MIVINFVKIETMKEKIEIDLSILIDLINKHSVDLRILGFTSFIQKAINVPPFFDEIHLCSSSPKEMFIDYVNTMSEKNNNILNNTSKYDRIPEIDVLFKNIKFPGIFLEVGHEALGSNPYILHKDINNIIKNI